jgi:V/A-type H+-transporting ATPase subunit I
MIVPMKKVGIIVEAKDAHGLVERLRSLGVVHVEHDKVPAGKDVEACQRDIELLDEAMAVLQEEIFIDETKTPVAPKKEKDWKQDVLHVIDLGKRYQHLKEFSRSLAVNIGEWEPWGDFDPQLLKTLREQGIYVRLYQVPATDLKKFPQDVVVEVLRTHNGSALCAVISRESVVIPFKEVVPPKMGLAAMKKRQEEDRRVMEDLVREGRAVQCHRECFLRQKKLLERNMEFSRAVAGMGQEGGLSYLTGYAPFDQIEMLSGAAKKEGWGLFVEDPSPEDRVPTLLRNPRWISLIQPVLKLLEITPGYKELDISPTFLIFFSLFFGILIGDAGYGLVYFLLTLWAYRKFGRKMKNKAPFFLMYLLSSCAVVWGVLSGVFFGQAWLASLGVKALVPQLNDTRFIQAFCFCVGAVHLSIAHLWRFAVLLPSPVAMAELGWLSIIWAAFFLAKTLLLGDPFPSPGKYLIIAGIALVVLFVNFQKNIFKAVGSGLGTLALSLVNNFTDVVSYIRLFAVGLATIAIADAFNLMAAGAASAGILGMAGAVLIVVAGHALNIVLGPMSVLVHGVRLNVLEFSGHAAVAWSGTPYQPLSNEATTYGTEVT